MHMSTTVTVTPYTAQDVSQVTATRMQKYQPTVPFAGLFCPFRNTVPVPLQMQGTQPPAPNLPTVAHAALPPADLHASPLLATEQGRPGIKLERASQPVPDIKVEPASQQADVKTEAMSQRGGPKGQQAAVKREVLSQRAAGSWPGGTGQAVGGEGAGGAAARASIVGRGALRELPGGPGQRPVARHVAVRVTP